MRYFTDFSRTQVIDGVEHVARVCERCGGTGWISHYRHVYDGACFACNSHAYPGGSDLTVKWEPRERAEKRERDNERRRAREAAKREAAAEEARRERAAAFDTWVADHQGTVERIFASADAHRVLGEFAETLRAGETLTDKQLAYAARLADEAEAATPVPAGRETVYGTVRTLRTQDSMYGTTLKMLVDCGTFRLWGTVPSSIASAVEVGDHVAFTATLTPSEAEPGFGFFARPARASIVDAA